jgi:signal transduction histidine kinase
MYRPPRVPPRSDVVLAVVLTVVCVGELYANYSFEYTVGSGRSEFHIATAVALGAAVAWRRVHPMLFAPFVFALLALQAQVVGHPNVYGEILVSVLALYGLTAYATSRRAASLSALACLGFAILMGFANTEDPIGETLTLIIFGMVVMLAGWVVHRQRDRADEMRDQRDRAERRAAEIAASERARIARELHDVVAHGMSVVVLQARGGRRMVERDPVRAHRAFDDIEQVASQSLDEMRRLLGILRSPEQEAELAPQPKLRELQALVEQARASGAAVDLVVAGSQRELAPAVELSAYRIAQEALTNSIKHAPGSTARIRVDYQPDDLAIEVTDDGPGMQGAEGGHGLIGMRERVELFGGTFHAGSEPGGGFAVRAVLPLAAVTA